MALSLQPLLLVSCRHCLRPITLAGGIADLPLAQLDAHVRECAPGEPPGWAGDPDWLERHFRIVGD